MRAFNRFNEIQNLPTLQEKQKAWLEDYDGLVYSKALDKKHFMKWKEDPQFYNKEKFTLEINCIGRKKDRLVIEFDGEPEKAKADFETTKAKLKERGIGFIHSSHESQKSDYLWVEFTRDLTEQEATNFLCWISPEGSEVDLNFTSDKRVFPVLFAKHWKYSSRYEMPIDFFEGDKIDYDSLNIPKIEIKETIRSGLDGFRYKTFVKSDGSKEVINVEDYLFSKGINKKTGKEEFGVDIDKVAEYIENKFNIRTIFGIREETIEVYEEGIWSVKGRGLIKAEIEQLLGAYSKNNVVSEVLEKIKRRTEISREEADNIPDYKRCVMNGVLDLENVKDIKFLPHSKEYNFRNKYPMDYNPEATCPKIQDFINKTFYEEDVPKVQEWLGFHLIRRYEFKRAVIIHGPKNTGKSVFLNLLNIFVNHNVSGLALQEIAKGKPFDLLVLKDKDANIHDDMSSQDMKSIGGFKMAVGDGFISAEQKFGDKIRFRNTAKDTNACNKLPNPGEDIDDEAYYERILLIPADNTITKEEQKKNLIDELTTPEELSGLLNWAIEGYKRLVGQNGFSNERSPEETKFLMLKNGNSLAEFAAEVLVESAGGKVTKDEMYMIYCKWCLEHKPKLSPDSKDKIGKNLVKFAPFVSSQSSGKERYWLNVKITDSYDTFLKNIRNISEEVKEGKNDVPNNIYVFSKPVIPVSKSLQNKVSEEPQPEQDFEDFSEELNWGDERE